MPPLALRGVNAPADQMLRKLLVCVSALIAQAALPIASPSNTHTVTAGAARLEREERARERMRAWWKGLWGGKASPGGTTTAAAATGATGGRRGKPALPSAAATAAAAAAAMPGLIPSDLATAPLLPRLVPLADTRALPVMMMPAAPAATASEPPVRPSAAAAAAAPASALAPGLGPTESSDVAPDTPGEAAAAARQSSVKTHLPLLEALFISSARHLETPEEVAEEVASMQPLSIAVPVPMPVQVQVQQPGSNASEPSNNDDGSGGGNSSAGSNDSGNGDDGNSSGADEPTVPDAAATAATNTTGLTRRSTHGVQPPVVALPETHHGAPTADEQAEEMLRALQAAAARTRGLS